MWPTWAPCIKNPTDKSQQNVAHLGPIRQNSNQHGSTTCDQLGPHSSKFLPTWVNKKWPAWAPCIENPTFMGLHNVANPGPYIRIQTNMGQQSVALSNPHGSTKCGQPGPIHQNSKQHRSTKYGLLGPMNTLNPKVQISN